ncbi:MAG: hypothetical protein ACNA71_06750 [Kiritimatiellia bacterium]
MKLREMAETNNWETLQTEFDDVEINAAYTSDLLSDVMAHAHDADLLITIQAHNNTVAVASLAGIRGIVICNDRPVPGDMLASAQKEQIGIFRTKANQFKTSCGIGQLLGA